MQYGWNAGPRHARIFGLIKNIKKKLSGEERDKHDQNVLGTFALTWNLLTVALPKEVILPTQIAISEANLPVMASQGDIQSQSPFLHEHPVLLIFYMKILDIL